MAKAKKKKQERDPKWQQLSQEVLELSGMKQWREDHPHASWQEIETALDERMNQLRAQMLQDAVQMSQMRGGKQEAEASRPRCGQCGANMIARGQHTRWVQTSGAQEVKLTRSYATCPSCGQGFFPSG